MAEEHSYPLPFVFLSPPLFMPIDFFCNRRFAPASLAHNHLSNSLPTA